MRFWNYIKINIVSAKTRLLHTIKVNRMLRKLNESKAANKPKQTVNGKAQ